MATGFIIGRYAMGLVHFSLPVCACLLGAAAAQATEVGVVGLFPGKAVLVVDGGSPRTYSVGRSEGGVKLIAVDRDSATLEVDGKRQRLTIGQHAFAGAGSDSGAQTVSLVADGRGHFVTTGTVNGATVRFMVDTGASAIAIGAADARRANVDLRNARPIAVQTANGVAQAWLVTLDTVRVGDVTLHSVEGAVIGQDMPQALLGMSFLNRMEMKREGETMTLRKRY